MTDKEKIRDFIKKLKEPVGHGDYWKGYKSALDDILTFIDSMQEDLKPKFKVGDKVRYKGHQCEGVITAITDTDYICGNVKLPISTQDNLEIIEECFYIVGGKSFNKSWEKYPEMIPELILSKQKPIGVPSDKVAPASIPDKKKVLVSKVWRDEREKGTKDIPVLFHSAFDNKWYAFNHSNDINWNIVDKWAYVEDLLNCTHSVTKKSDWDDQVPEDLKKFAEEWDESLYRSDAVIAGAKWQEQRYVEEGITPQDAYFGHLLEESWAAGRSAGTNEYKKQLMKDAVKGTVFSTLEDGKIMVRSHYFNSDNLHYGEKIKLIVIKED